MHGCTQPSCMCRILPEDRHRSHQYQFNIEHDLGTLETIHGVTCYVATPTVDYPKDKVILFLPDVFGIELFNAKVVVVDRFNGDSLPADDFETYLTKSHAPLLTNSCEIDEMFPAAAQKKADEIFDDGKFAPGYKREFFPGCTNEFSVRGDTRDPLVKAGKEGSFKAAVEFFLERLCEVLSLQHYGVCIIV
ncbi:hypothetical protein BDR03DRAFT_171801 [Suillus americanus]|nr:hypothetical protein BDR03DRAFT_171801 [Suillus americanus]